MNFSDIPGRSRQGYDGGLPNNCAKSSASRPGSSSRLGSDECWPHVGQSTLRSHPDGGVAIMPFRFTVRAGPISRQADRTTALNQTQSPQFEYARRRPTRSRQMSDPLRTPNSARPNGSRPRSHRAVLPPTTWLSLSTKRPKPPCRSVTAATADRRLPTPHPGARDNGYRKGLDQHDDLLNPAPRL